MKGMCFEDLITRQGVADTAGEWFQSGKHAAFLVDQSAINIECEGLEVSQ